MADDTVVIDVDTLTIGDIEDVEDIVGRPVMTDVANRNFSGKLLTALVTVIKRKTDPTFTPEQARNIRVADLAGKQPDPTGANAPTG